MERSAGYTLRFAALVGVIASAVVATASVVLDSRQQANRLLHRQRQVLEVVGLGPTEGRFSAGDVTRLFDENIRTLAIDLESGMIAPDIDPSTFDQERATQDPATSRPAPANAARVPRLPRHALVYLLLRGNDVDAVVLPFQGVGLWSTVHGFIALESDLSRVRGVTFYEHAETAGLGARISDPAWRSLWVGRRVFDDEWRPRLTVVKGRAPPAGESPFEVDGISGATLTGNGVTKALQFWLGDQVLGPYLTRYRAERGIT
jgi:Na+-transporting NADH:ubiquinone oxidoreductase subunit C